MLASVDAVLFEYATMSLTNRNLEHGTLAKLAIMKFASEATKQRLKNWSAGFHKVLVERVANETSLIVVATSTSGHSTENGASGPGVVAEEV